MTVETQLILDRIDASERQVNGRLTELRADMQGMGRSLHETALAVVIARNVADEAALKVGQVHSEHKVTAAKVADLVVAETTLAKHYGRTLRWRDVLLVVGTVGGLYSIARTLGLIHF